MHLRASWIRSLPFTVSCVSILFVAATPLRADGATPRPSICAEEGVTPSPENGASCRELGRRSLEGLGTDPVYWHVSRLTGAERAAGVGADSWIVEAEDEAWVYAIGPRDAAPRVGEPLASIGPLPVRPERRYDVVTYFAALPPGVSTAAHGHSGPEAWFLLSGAQCVETPGGTSRVRAGESMVAQPSVPMRITSTGPGTRRALSIVLRDPEGPVSLASAWLPTGACHPATADRPMRSGAPAVPLADGERAVRRALRQAGDASARATVIAKKSSAATEPATAVEPPVARESLVTSEPAVGSRTATVARPVAVSKVPAPIPPAAGNGSNGGAYFSFAGLSLDSTLAEVRDRYPRSRTVGHYLYVAPEDARDHVHGIEVSDGSPVGRVRLTFERRPNGAAARPAYPACGEIEEVLERRYGRPTGVRNFYEEASRRSDRIWVRRGERLELLCFGAPERLEAEAVVIYPSSS